jgi:tetratricopeptide (TPR) repeat protein
MLLLWSWPASAEPELEQQRDEPTPSHTEGNDRGEPNGREGAGGGRRHRAIDPAGSSRAQRSEALRERAATEYRLGHFRKAIVAFKEALRLEKKPSLLLNLAQCYRQIRDADKALFYYKLYLTEWRRSNPQRPPPYEQEVQEHISRLTTQQRASRSKALALQTTGPPDARDRPREESKPIYKRWWFWTIVGVAVVGSAATAAAVTMSGGDDWRPTGPDLTGEFE